jgi:hypothetical protein
MTNNAKPNNTGVVSICSLLAENREAGQWRSTLSSWRRLYSLCTHLKGDEDLDTGEEKFFVVFLRDFVPVVTRGTMFSSFFRLFYGREGRKNRKGV